MRDLTWHFRPFHHWPPMTSSTPFDDFRTKFSAADSMLTSIFKQIINVIAPFIVALFNRSLAAGNFPAGFKEAFLS